MLCAKSGHPRYCCRLYACDEPPNLGSLRGVPQFSKTLRESQKPRQFWLPSKLSQRCAGLDVSDGGVRHPAQPDRQQTSLAADGLTAGRRAECALDPHRRCRLWREYGDYQADDGRAVTKEGMID